MPKVLNKRTDKIPSGAVYVGRPTKWGNPYILGRDGDRQEVILRYRRWITDNDGLLASLDELRGKDLICWCAPEPCHADVLMELANKLTSGVDDER